MHTNTHLPPVLRKKPPLLKMITYETFHDLVPAYFSGLISLAPSICPSAAVNLSLLGLLQLATIPLYSRTSHVLFPLSCPLFLTLLFTCLFPAHP